MRSADLNTRITLLTFTSFEGFEASDVFQSTTTVTVWAALNPKPAIKYSNQIHHYAPCYEVIIRRLDVNSKQFNYNRCLIDGESYEIQDVQFWARNFIKFEAVKIE